MSQPIDPRSFGRVEQAEDSDSLVRYLQEACALDAMQAMNEYLLQVLDIRPRQRVLDVGCGTGEDVHVLASAVGPSGKAVGVDSATMVAAARAREGSANVEFVEGDAHALPFEDATFDRYRAHRVYMHLQEPAVALAEAFRVVRPGGVVVISEPDWGALVLDDDDRELTAAVLHAIQDAMQEPWIGRRLPRLFRATGFTNVQLAPQFGLFSDYDTAHRFLLATATDQVVRSGAYTADEVEAWLAGLVERERAGSFFFGALTVVVRGRRPQTGVLAAIKRRLRGS